MGKKKFYAIVKGGQPGIYDEWFGRKGAAVQVTGFPGAIFKGFASRQEAKAWFNKTSKEASTAQQSTTATLAERAIVRGKASRWTKPIIEKTSVPRRALVDGKVMIYTDGGCIKNPGPGGYGVVLLYGDWRKEISGGYSKTTNNRMELTACIKGLETLKHKCSVILYSDSQYVVNGIEKGWAKRWKRNNWRRSDTDLAENSDLWSRLLDLCEKHDVTFIWVRGHHGNPENERCDTLAGEMSRRGDLPPDYGYVRK